MIQHAPTKEQQQQMQTLQKTQHTPYRAWVDEIKSLDLEARDLNLDQCYLRVQIDEKMDWMSLAEIK